MLKKAKDALSSLVKAVDKTTLGSLCLAALIAAVGARAAFANRQAYLNINVNPMGVSTVTDLTASTGPSTGQISLTWTEPQRKGTVNPVAYDIRVSSAGEISNTGQFLAAQPLSAFSPSPIPAVGPAGALAGMVVTSLAPGVTYYFAIRAADSSAPPYAGVWNRIVARGINPSNFAQAGYTPGGPAAITDLAAAQTGVPGQVKLTWTAPSTSVQLATYTVVCATRSVADLAGDTTAWFNLAFATRTFLTTTHSSGTLETTLIDNLPPSTTIFFGIKAQDIVGQVGPIDAKSSASGGVNQVKINMTSSIEVTASTGPTSGSVLLSWAEPYSAGLTPPLTYLIHVSTVANIPDNAAFAAAAPLSAFSGTTIPAPGAGGATVNLPVTGLIPGVTYYFAIREQDSSAPTPIITNWVRNVAGGINPNNFAPATFLPNAPDAVTDLAAATAAGEGNVTLTWTAPRNQNYVPMSSYEVRFGTFSEAALGGDATAWFNVSAASSVVIPALTPGATVTVNVGGLYPLATWYFEVRSADQRGELSPVDARATFGVQASTMPGNDPPAAPSGLTAVAGLRSASLSWLDLTPPQKGLDFAFYRLYRSTQATTGFVQVSTTPGLSFVDKPLIALTTYYYKLVASEGPGGLDSVASSTVSVVPFTLAPQEPFGFLAGASSASVTFQWSPTTRFADTSLFFSTGTPAPDELVGYKVFRSTNICDPTFVQVSTLTLSSTTFTDNTAGANDYFYQIRSYNTFAASTATLTLSALGDEHFFLDDCASEVVMTREQASVLRKSSNTLGGDVLIERRRRGEDTGNGVMQSAEFKALLNGVTELKNFYLPTPARVVLHYLTDADGAPVPQAISGLAKPEAGRPQGAASDPKNLGMYWYNGAQWNKLYGTVDTLGQSVSVQSPNLGVYQVRSQLRSDGVVFDISNVSSKVITPNDDGLNDVLIVTYDPGPENVMPTGVIYDLKGAVVASMVPGLVPDTLTWDGKMNGRAVTSGVYVYQIKGGGKTFNGTVVVAR